MWLILQIFAGVLLAFLALAVLAVLWWRHWGFFAFRRWWKYCLDEFSAAVRDSIRDAMRPAGDRLMEVTATLAFANSRFDLAVGRLRSAVSGTLASTVVGVAVGALFKLLRRQ